MEAIYRSLARFPTAGDLVAIVRGFGYVDQTDLSHLEQGADIDLVR